MKKQSKKIINIFIPYYLPDTTYGGPITSINSISNLLSKDKIIKIHTTSLSFHNQKQIPLNNEKINSKNIEIIRTKSHFLNLISTSLKFLKIRNQIIYINSIFYLPNSLPFFLFSKISNFIGYGNTFIVSPRSELQKEKILAKKYFLKLIFLKIFQLFASKEIIFISASKNEFFSNNYKFPKNKHKILPNLTRFNRFKKYSKKSNPLKLLFFSRISEEKGLHLFLNELKKTKQSLPLEISIMGSYSEKKYYEKIKKLTNILLKKGYQINIEGHLDSDLDNLNRYDVMILPTIAENFSHTIVEASQSGLFCLISDNTPWFKNTKGAEENLTHISLKKMNDYIKALKRIHNLKNEELKLHVYEQQKEVNEILSLTISQTKAFFKLISSS